MQEVSTRIFYKDYELKSIVHLDANPVNVMNKLKNKISEIKIDRKFKKKFLAIFFELFFLSNPRYQ